MHTYHGQSDYPKYEGYLQKVRQRIKTEDKVMQKHTSTVTLTSVQTSGSMNATVTGLGT